MNLSDVLNKLITITGVSKNYIIKETGIDRSTFFQILNGKRFPSKSVFSSLLHFFISYYWKNESPLEGSYVQTYFDNLYQSYIQNSLEFSDLALWHLSRDFIKKTNMQLTLIPQQSAGSPDKTSDMIATFLHRQLSLPCAELDFYLSPQLIKDKHILLSMRNSIISPSNIRQIIGLYQNSQLETIQILLDSLAHYIGMLNRYPSHYAVYCADDTLTGKKNHLFPYYMIGSTELLLISQDGKNLLLSTDQKAIHSYRSQFNELIQSLEPLFSPIENYMNLAQYLFDRNNTAGDKTIFSIAERPCFWQMVTPEVIKKYAPNHNIEQFGIEYANVLQSIPHFYALNSLFEINQFRKGKFVTEAGINIQLDDADMTLLEKKLAEVIWKKILFLPFNDCFIHNWEIALYYPDELFISPYSNTNHVMHIRNKNIIKSLYIYYSNMQKIL